MHFQYITLRNNIEIGKGPSKQHIGGDFFSDLVGTVKDAIAEAFEDKLEKEIFIEEKLVEKLKHCFACRPVH